LETAPSPRLSLGKYQLVRHLASGGMADVILARIEGIEGFERHVVIKKIREERAHEQRFVQMFLDEARLAASLHHNNIVHVHDIGQEDGEYFFTMEYVHGEDLRRLLAHMADEGRLVPLDHCITIALATAAALHHAHEHRTPDRHYAGIVHRDVSPANILVAYDGNVKVVDFGIAKLAQRTEETGLMKGKVAYMSPEQCLGHDVDRRSDVFCLGIVLYELVTVRRLFKGANDFLTMAAITHGVIPSPSMLRPEVPAELEAIILKALAQKPEDRYQTANEMRAALERFAVNARLQTSTTALADFMQAEFGERDVPWMEAEEEPELSIDFDGSGAGIVAAPDAVLAAQAARLRPRRTSLLPTPARGTGPVMRASSPSATSLAATEPTAVLPVATAPAAWMPLVRMPLAGTPLAATPAAGMPVVAMPVALAPIPAPTLQHRRRMYAAAAAAVAAIAIAAIALMSGSSDKSAPASSGVAAPVVAPSSPEVMPVAAPAPITPPNLVPSAPDPAAQVRTAMTTSQGATTTDPASGEKKPVRPAFKRPPATKKPPPKGVWDPKALLPPKSK
jgi:serine/threonine-protein kinase